MRTYEIYSTRPRAGASQSLEYLLCWKPRLVDHRIHCGISQSGYAKRTDRILLLEKHLDLSKVDFSIAKRQEEGVKGHRIKRPKTTQSYLGNMNLENFELDTNTGIAYKDSCTVNLLHFEV